MDLPRIQDDLYHAINGEWLESAVIPDDRPTTGGFAILDQGVEKLLMGDFAEFASGKKEIPDILGLSDAVRLYKKAMDVDTRAKQGVEPVLPLLREIASLQNKEEFSLKAKEFADAGMVFPFDYGVTADMADATRNCFVLTGPEIILPDTPFYAEGHPAKAQLLAVYSQMADAALSFLPLSEEERKLYIADTLAFDELCAKSVKSQLEWADYVKNHNPMGIEEVASYMQGFDIKKLLGDIYGEKAPSVLIVYDPRAIKEFSSYFNDETFAKFVHWSYVKTFLTACPYLSLELRSIASTYRRALMGVAKDPDLDKDAYQTASGLFAEPIGVYYGRTYFGEEAKKDIVSLVYKIIETYKKRVKENPFLSEPTKEKAILKLSTITVKMGYPDFVHDIYAKMALTEEESYFEAVRKIRVIRVQDNLDDLNRPVDRTKWGMPGHMVNASYNPSKNDITFPAAILQKPFYSLSQKVEENLGGIGAVIGHEISHAFDNNGANFDENGNLAQWWTPEDFAAFKELTKKMIEQFDGIPFHGGKVSGELVVSENIADNGGMAVTLEIMHTLKNPSYQDYFKNWARVWCQKAKEEYIQLLLQRDVHSPAELRANIMPRNFPEWYEAFDVKETDGMFLPEDKRIIIW